MADPNDKFSENVPGPWYVDNTCISCGQCDDTAPSIFKRSDAYDQNFVFHQPDSDSEMELAVEARDRCPVEAIGNDG